ncbi:MAG: Gram-negative bacterial TonB protein C-terminal [Verrucomicrobiota bacterium]|jgi:TonB family protein
MMVLCAIGPSLFAERPDVTVPPSATRFMVSTPRPEYPDEARLRRITGRGLYDVTFDAKTGAATRVKVLETTGSGVLDDAATKALMRWRARRPGIVARARIPFTFTLIK